jgi:RNA polymerase sigma-70 factor (ECF subfamily)
MNPRCHNSFDAPTSPCPSDEFEEALIALMPYLRSLSRKLCNGRAIAEDMVQDTLTKAWAARASFVPGSNLKAWLFTILRNEVYSHGRRAWRDAHWDPVKGERIASPPDSQERAMELCDTARAMRTLPQSQREAMVLISLGGYSYKEGAKISGMAAGTMKSRVARGRNALLMTLEGKTPLPRRSAVGAHDAADSMLAQLAALASRGAGGASICQQ